MNKVKNNKKKTTKKSKNKIKKAFKYGTLKDILLILIMLVLIGIVSLFIVGCVYVIITAPDISEERLYKGNSTVLLDKDGVEFARLGTENREKVTYDELPEVLVDAIVATEDSRFFQHNGIDIARFSKAVVQQLLGQDAGGGSTLTMQVSKQAATSSVRSGLAGITRKFQDIYLAVFVFEKKFTKEQILEFYVNLPGLGAGAYGVEQASQIYFGKSVSELNLTEAALIAGLFQAPSSYNPYNHPQAATKRRNTVLNLMYRHGYITEEERDAAAAVDVESLLIGKDNDLNEYQGFIDTVVEEVLEDTGKDPYKVSMEIHTTLDRSKQNVINDIYSGKTYTWKNDEAQAGIAVVDVESGALVAVGAGRNKTTERSFNFATDAYRQPGSTAKPIVDYGPAIEYLGWSTGQTLVDDETTYSNKQSIKNWDNSYKGVLTAKAALAQSRNIPALLTFQQTTNEQKKTFASSLGWNLLDDGAGTLLESDSIGGFDGVSPVQEAGAYAAFARGGIYIEPYTYTKIVYTDTGDEVEKEITRTEAMSEETAYMINYMLKYAVTSGNVTAGKVSGTDICAKTGTTNLDSSTKKNLGLSSDAIKDAWEVSYSPDYVIALWYGYKDLNKEHYLTNNEGRNARNTMSKLLDNGIFEKNSTFKKPSGVVSATIELGTDPLALASSNTPDEYKSTELFKKGTVPSETSNRFETLDNPSDLKYTVSEATINVSWTAAATPKAIDEEYLTKYFNDSKIYNRWASKYTQKRLEENNALFGSFGYHVYLETSTGTTDLGFTTNTSFTINTNITDNMKVIVKSSYEKFTSNQSKGISVQIEANKVIEETTTVTEVNFITKYAGSTKCSTVEDYNNLGSSVKDKIIVTSNNQNVTDKANISLSCYTEDTDTQINCDELENNKAYLIVAHVKYENSEQNYDIHLKEKC